MSLYIGILLTARTPVVPVFDNGVNWPVEKDCAEAVVAESSVLDKYQNSASASELPVLKTATEVCAGLVVV